MLARRVRPALRAPRPHAPQCQQQRRRFETRAEHAVWRQRVVCSCAPRSPAAVAGRVATDAPLLAGVDPMSARLEVLACPTQSTSSPSASMLEVTFPLASDLALRLAVAEAPGTSWSTFRLSKFYEALDALTGDVAYRHTGCAAHGISLVTAGHYHSRKLRRTDINRDVFMRCYITATGGASLEVRTDAIQLDPITGLEQLVNVCHTTMVTVDGETLLPVSGFIPALSSDEHDSDGQQQRADLAAWHNRIRKTRGGCPLELRSHNSVPPSAPEMQKIHAMNRRVLEEQQLPPPRPARPTTVADATYISSHVIYPEQRNIHGKLFGGWVAATAFDLASYGAKFFAHGGKVTACSALHVPCPCAHNVLLRLATCECDVSPNMSMCVLQFPPVQAVSLGLDEAVFLQVILYSTKNDGDCAKYDGQCTQCDLIVN